MRLWELRLLFMHCAWTVATKFDFSYLFQSISAHHALFMDPQISFFSNFFIKNGSQVLFTYLKIILLQYFSIFSFQLYPNGPLIIDVYTRIGKEEIIAMVILVENLWSTSVYWNSDVSAGANMGVELGNFWKSRVQVLWGVAIKKLLKIFIFIFSIYCQTYFF